MHWLASHTVPDAHPAVQGGQCLSVEDVSDHAVGLALIEASLGPASDDTTRILTAMLEERETFTDLRRRLLSRVMEDETANAAHWVHRSYLRTSRSDRTDSLL